MKNRIKQIRTMLGLSQSDFAKKLSVSRSAVCKMESGENNPSEQTIVIICKEFNVNESWIKTGDGQPFVERTNNQKIASFVNDVMGEDDTFRKRFLEAQASLTDEDWLVIEKIVNKISKK